MKDQEEFQEGEDPGSHLNTRRGAEGKLGKAGIGQVEMGRMGCVGENGNLRNVKVDVGTLNVEGTGVERLKGG